MTTKEKKIKKAITEKILEITEIDIKNKGILKRKKALKELKQLEIQLQNEQNNLFFNIQKLKK